jgi:hypothetical protein
VTTWCRGDHELAAEYRGYFTRHVLPKRRVRRRRAWWLAVPALAAVVACVIVLRGGGVQLTAKGGAAWQVFAHRDSAIVPVHDGDRLDEGDQIRFVVMPDGAPYLLIASIDGAGRASIYYPYGGAASAPIRGSRVEIDGSIVLDDAPGAERIYALLSDEPLDAGRIEELLRAIGAGGVAAIRAASTLDVPVRRQLSLLVDKP